MNTVWRTQGGHSFFSFLKRVDEDDSCDLVWIKESEGTQRPKELISSTTEDHRRRLSRSLNDAKRMSLSENRADWARGFHRAELRLSIPVDTDSELSEVMILLKRSPSAIQLFNAAKAALNVFPLPWKQTKSIELYDSMVEIATESMLAAINE